MSGNYDSEPEEQSIKANISLKELETLRYSILCKYPQSGETLTLITLKEFAGLIRRKGINLEISFEEETIHEAEE